jgi:succinate-semialdehyde dehydrogenase
MNSTVNPANSHAIQYSPPQTRDAWSETVARSAEAFVDWRRTDIAFRSTLVLRLGSVLRAEVGSLARCITAEMGKPISQSKAEVLKCASLCDWYAKEAPRLLKDELVDVGGDGEAHIAYLPIGLILAVMPWNFPLWQALRAAVPIMVAGNCFLLKHADNVPISARNLAAACEAAGIPTGVFGLLSVDNAAIPSIIADKRISGVTVTAGVEAGAAVAAEAGRHLKKSVLELGGSDPFIVLADADLDCAVRAAIASRFHNTGQVCIAAKRFIIERPIAEEFVRRFTLAASQLKMGDPLDPNIDLGPMARHALRVELHKQVQESVAMGAKLMLGGTIPDGPSAYYPATVLTDVTPHMPVFKEETFGPVAAITVADDVSEAVMIANDSDYGLSAALWTSNLDNSEMVARSIDTGAVFVNGISVSDPRIPIGGIKRSGYGRELSYFGLREFCNTQLRWVRSVNN